MVRLFSRGERGKVRSFSPRARFPAIHTYAVSASLPVLTRSLDGSQADLSRTVIAVTALPFITDGVTILVHGYSNVVMYILQGAARQGVRFKVVVTEGQPERDGYKTAKVCLFAFCLFVYQFFSRVCECVCMYVSGYLCVYIYICVVCFYVSVCLCVCVCARMSFKSNVSSRRLTTALLGLALLD